MTRPNRPRKSKPPIREAGSLRKGPRTSLPEELAHDAVAHEKAAPGDRVEMVFRLRFSKVVAEALTARAVRGCGDPRGGGAKGMIF